MSLSKLNFSKTWLSSADFPTVETDEQKVREDMQCLHDETKEAFNKLIDDLCAEEIPFDATQSIQATNVQAAIENVQAQIVQASTAQILPGSISGEMLVDGAVGSSKLTDGSVSGAKIATDAVTAGKIASGAVTTNKIADGAVTADKLANNLFPNKADLDADGIVVRNQMRLRPYNRSTGAIALASSSVGRVLLCYPGGHYNSGGTFVKNTYRIQVPVDSTILPGSVVVVANLGGETVVKIEPMSSVVIYKKGGALSIGSYTLDDYETVILIKISDNAWVLGGLS